MKKNYSFTVHFSEKTCYTFKKSLFLKAFFGLLFLVFILTPVNYFSQEVTINGSENMYITEGALIITNNETIAENISNTISREKKSKTANAPKIKKIKKDTPKLAVVKKIISDKIIKDIKKSQKPIIIYDGNADSPDTIYSSSENSSKCVVNEKDTQLKFSLTENSIDIISLEYDRHINILYRFYRSKNTEESLFTRPPPCYYI